jgi:hypothetical protein
MMPQVLVKVSDPHATPGLELDINELRRECSYREKATGSCVSV